MEVIINPPKFISDTRPSEFKQEYKLGAAERPFCNSFRPGSDASGNTANSWPL